MELSEHVAESTVKWSQQLLAFEQQSNVDILVKQQTEWTIWFSELSINRDVTFPLIQSQEDHQYNPKQSYTVLN